MKNLSLKMTLFCFLLSFSAFASTTSKINFFQGTLEQAQQKAASEGKLLAIDFYANWCQPCKWMEEKTFTDPQLGSYANQNYIFYKVNIDDFDGYPIGRQYDIQLLPTILVFNSKGKQLAKHETTFNAANLIETLKSYDISSNRVVVGGGTIKPVVESPTPAKTDPKPSNSNFTKIAPELYSINLKKQEALGFSIQVAVYQQFSNVLRETLKLQKSFPNQLIIFQVTDLGNRIDYKIMVGNFPSREGANKFKQEMSAKGISNTVIKDLSTL